MREWIVYRIRELMSETEGNLDLVIALLEQEMHTEFSDDERLTMTSLEYIANAVEARLREGYQWTIQEEV